MHIGAGHVDSNWPEFTFAFTFISCLNRLALSAISLKQILLAIYFSLLFSLVSIYIKGESFESASHNAQTIDNQQEQPNQVPSQSPVKRISTGQQYCIFFLQQQ